MSAFPVSLQKMPLKLELTARLIEAEDVEAMQKVLDLSINIIGEEKSLYDLALNFLDQGGEFKQFLGAKRPWGSYSGVNGTFFCLNCRHRMSNVI